MAVLQEYSYFQNPPIQMEALHHQTQSATPAAGVSPNNIRRDDSQDGQNDL